MAVVKRTNPPFSIYPPSTLKNRIAVIAKTQNRSVNGQIMHWLERAVEQAESREMERRFEPSIAEPAGAKQRVKKSPKGEMAGAK